jgi:superfamily I DNA and/or RNA helicase
LNVLQNRSYFRTQSKSKQIQEDQNNPLHHIRSQQTSTTKETPENIKHMETEQQWVTEVIREDIRKYLEPNENEKTICQNLWGTAMAVLRGKFIAISAYIKKKRLLK